MTTDWNGVEAAYARLEKAKREKTRRAAYALHLKGYIGQAIYISQAEFDMWEPVRRERFVRQGGRIEKLECK